MALVVFAMGGILAPTSLAATSANEAATHAYLLASNDFAEAELANLRQSTAAVDATAAKISGECPGVLTGAPPPKEEFRSVRFRSVRPILQSHPSARETGERQRETRQRGDLQLELSLALTSSETVPNRAASEALLRTVSALRWSNPEITFFVHLTATYIQEELGTPTPDVCADMRSWVSSGYKTLSVASKELVKRSEAALKQVFELIALATSGELPPLPKLLAKYESPADRKLEHHTERLAARLRPATKSKAAVLAKLETTVGLPPPFKSPRVKPTVKKPVMIARGQTAAGGSFIVSAAPAPKEARSQSCTTEVSISEPARPGSSGVGSLLSGNLLNDDTPERCLSRSHVDARATVRCSSGLLTVEADLLPAARSVRLLLSNKRTVTSTAILVPADLGGPAGLYYQVLRGPSPIPVSLTELDANGKAVDVLKLAPVVECAKKLVKYFPGGIVPLAQGSLTLGPTFSIHAERYRELGQIHFELKLTVSNEEALFGSGSEGGLSLQGENTLGNAFEPQTSSGCTPQPYEIIYGLLKAPGDTVLARVSGNLVALENVAIPAHLHAGGVLAYGAFSPMPTELVTRNAQGVIVSTNANLAEAARTFTEACEGEAEG